MLTQILESEKQRYFALRHSDPASIGDIPQLSGVIHLAGMAHRSQGELADYREANVDWAYQVAKIALQKGALRFIYVSTIKVNGEHSGEGGFRPEDAPEPNGPYAVSKLEGERQLAQFLSGKMEFIAVRPPLIYGPGVKGNLDRLMRYVQMGMPMPFGAARGTRSLIASRNLSGFLAHLAKLGKSLSDYNVPSHSANVSDYLVFLPSDLDISSADLIREIARAMHRSARLIPIPAWFFRPTGFYDRLFSSLTVEDNRCRQIGWKNNVTPEQAIEEMVGHFLARYA